MSTQDIRTKKTFLDCEQVHDVSTLHSCNNCVQPNYAKIIKVQRNFLRFYKFCNSNVDITFARFL